MKKSNLFLIVLFTMALILTSVLTKTACADDWSITPAFGVFIPTGSEGIIQDGIKYGVVGKYKAAILKLQRIDAGTRYVGQSGEDLSFNTIMVGFEYEFKPTYFGIFGISFAGGLAMPDYEKGYQYFPTTHSEGLWRHTNHEASFGSSDISNIGRPYLFDKYRVDYDIAPIIEVNLKYTHPFKYGAFFATAGYTYLSITEDIKAIDEPNINGGWRIINQLDCSGATFMIGWKWLF